MNLETLTTGAKVQKFDISRALLFAPSAAAILVSIAIAFFIVWPRFGDVLSLQKNNKILQENAAAREQKAVELVSVDRTKLKAYLLAASQMIPSDKNIFSFIGQVEETRNYTGVAITNLSVGTVGQFGAKKPDSAGSAPPAPPAGVEGEDLTAIGASAVQMKLSLVSDYRSIMAFLDSIYALPRVAVVKDISFSSAESQITTTMSVNALWAPLPTELAPVDSPLVTLSKNQEDLLSKIENLGTATVQPVVPEVPKGRNDIFTPFGQ